MPPETPFSGRLTQISGGNGYESPGPSLFKNEHNHVSDGGLALADHNGRRRGICGDIQNSNHAHQSYFPSQTRRDDSSLTEKGQQSDEEGSKRRYGLRDRISCYTWTWFTMTMATGGVANVLHASKYR